MNGTITPNPFRLGLLVCALLFGGCAPSRVVYPGDDPNLPFSKAVRVGDTLYVAGHLGIDPARGTPPTDPAAEARAMLDAFAATLSRAGMRMSNLVQVQVFCSDVALYETFNREYRSRFSADFPARAFVGSGTLLRGARFEITGIAVGR